MTTKGRIMAYFSCTNEIQAKEHQQLNSLENTFGPKMRQAEPKLRVIQQYL